MYCIQNLVTLFAQNALKYSIMFGLFFNDRVYFVPFERIVINCGRKKIT